VNPLTPNGEFLWKRRQKKVRQTQRLTEDRLQQEGSRLNQKTQADGNFRTIPATNVSTQVNEQDKLDKSTVKERPAKAPVMISMTLSIMKLYTI
jgi:hypothetical protein